VSAGQGARPGPRVVVAPPVPALLPSYSSLTDPVAALRAASVAAVAWLGDPVEVVADSPQARRVGEALVAAARDGVPGGPRPAPGGTPRLLVMANGSARRSEKAPGHLDERSFAFDDTLGQAIGKGDLRTLAELDLGLGADLLTAGLGGLAGLSGRGLTVRESTTDYADDPFGVMYWVVRWQCDS
jgi:hypothetical protein